MDEKRIIWKDKEEFIKMHIETIKKSLSENLPKLPNEELPFMEPHLRALYFEAYFLMAEGFYNAGLDICAILLEITVKEKLFMAEISDDELERLDFGDAIEKANSMKLLNDEELNFLDTKRRDLRNPYLHFNQIKLTKDIYFPTWKIPSEQITPKIIDLYNRVNKGELSEADARKELIKGIKPELMSSKEIRPIAITAKSEMEKQKAIPIFLEIDKFVREFSEKHFKPNQS